MAAAAPDAWRDDALFRWAGIGAGVCLLTLLVGSVGKSVPHLKPGIGAPSLPPLPPAVALSVVTPSGAPIKMPRVAPGRPLGSATILPPALYKLRVWLACTPQVGVDTSAKLLLKAPSELNVHALTSADLLHKDG